jgi:hypothetical protein
MKAVEGYFPDYSNDNRKGSFKIYCDKTMFPGHWIPPISWTGYVNNTAVKFTQISQHSYNQNDFDFTDFPAELEGAKSSIIDAIDKAMKVMD